MQQQCDFCYRHCTLDDGAWGFCHARKNEQGQIVSPYKGSLVSVAIDPIEKKPLYHFLPGSGTLTIAEQGCNYRCKFCQNYSISQPGYAMEAEHIEPERLVAFAKQKGLKSISFSYSEPLVWQDYLLEVANEAKKENIKTVMVSNGSFSPEARERIIPIVDAYNIDLKGDDTFYREVCDAREQPVLDGIEAIVKAGKHLEVTTLVIEGIHTDAMIRTIGKDLKQRGVNVWHLSRFFPMYHMEDRGQTSEQCLRHMISIAKESGIPYIYGGNSQYDDATICPNCKTVVIKSHRYGEARAPKDGICPQCKQKLYGVF